MNFKTTKEISGSGEYFGTADSFFSKMPSAWENTKSIVLKMETRQKYVEPDSDSWKSWMIDGNWEASMTLLPKCREVDVPLYQDLRERGVEFVRTRPVVFPLTDYMKWEFEVFKFNAEHGERIFCANSNSVPGFVKNVAQHDSMIFDASLACIHDYDLEGQIVGGWWLRDQSAILELMKIHAFLRASSIEFHRIYQANAGRLGGS